MKRSHGRVGRAARRDHGRRDHRSEGTNITIVTEIAVPDEALLAFHAGFRARLLRHFAHEVYVNEMGSEGEDRVREAYTPQAYERLVALKNKYDPTNPFHLNQNIKPTV